MDDLIGLAVGEDGVDPVAVDHVAQGECEQCALRNTGILNIGKDDALTARHQHLGCEPANEAGAGHKRCHDCAPVVSASSIIR